MELSALTHQEDCQQDSIHAAHTTPSPFFQSIIDQLPPGRLLLVTESQLGCALYAACRGWQVTLLDYGNQLASQTREQATALNLSVDYRAVLLETFDAPPAAFDLVALLFAHMPPILRQRVHRNAVEWVRPAGHLLLEAFHKRQLGRPTGGPREQACLYSVPELAVDFRPMQLLLARDQIEQLASGPYPAGEAALVQLIARQS
ncbi:hypothetical protein GCM10027578_07760 [Spirosoma luteolum]